MKGAVVIALDNPISATAADERELVGSGSVALHEVAPVRVPFARGLAHIGVVISRDEGDIVRRPDGIEPYP
jgi:hypothetical protein